MSRLILLVEGDPGLRRTLQRDLVQAGYTVFEAATVPQGLLLAGPGGRGLDLVIADADLPGISGVELLRVLRLYRPDLPAISLARTLLAREVVLDPALAWVSWLTRPLAPARIVMEAHTLLGTPRVPAHTGADRRAAGGPDADADRRRFGS